MDTTFHLYLRPPSESLDLEAFRRLISDAGLKNSGLESLTKQSSIDSIERVFYHAAADAADGGLGDGNDNAQSSDSVSGPHGPGGLSQQGLEIAVDLLQNLVGTYVDSEAGELSVRQAILDVGKQKMTELKQRWSQEVKEMQTQTQENVNDGSSGQEKLDQESDSLKNEQDENDLQQTDVNDSGVMSSKTRSDNFVNDEYSDNQQSVINAPGSRTQTNSRTGSKSNTGSVVGSWNHTNDTQDSKVSEKLEKQNQDQSQSQNQPPDGQDDSKTDIDNDFLLKHEDPNWRENYPEYFSDKKSKSNSSISPRFMQSTGRHKARNYQKIFSLHDGEWTNPLKQSQQQYQVQSQKDLQKHILSTPDFAKSLGGEYKSVTGNIRDPFTKNAAFGSASGGNAHQSGSILDYDAGGSNLNRMIENYCGNKMQIGSLVPVVEDSRKGGVSGGGPVKIIRVKNQNNYQAQKDIEYQAQIMQQSKPNKFNQLNPKQQYNSNEHYVDDFQRPRLTRDRLRRCSSASASLKSTSSRDRILNQRKFLNEPNEQNGNYGTYSSKQQYQQHFQSQNLKPTTFSGPAQPRLTQSRSGSQSQSQNSGTHSLNQNVSSSSRSRCHVGSGYQYVRGNHQNRTSTSSSSTTLMTQSGNLTQSQSQSHSNKSMSNLSHGNSNSKVDIGHRPRPSSSYGTGQYSKQQRQSWVSDPSLTPHLQHKHMIPSARANITILKDHIYAAPGPHATAVNSRNLGHSDYNMSNTNSKLYSPAQNYYNR